MRAVLTLLALFAFVASSSAAPIKVVTWNTRWLPGGKPDASESEKTTQMAAAKEIVAKLNPDILLLQEVADWKAAEELCTAVPGLHVNVVSNFETRPQNLVIASKFPVSSAWYAPWKPVLGPDSPPRGYAFAAIELPDKTTLLTYTVHFKSNREGIPIVTPARIEAAKQLLAHITEMNKIYSPGKKIAVLVGGDFNTSLDGREFQPDGTLKLIRSSGLKWVFSMMSFSSRITIPGEGGYPDQCFDHLFYSGLTLKSVRVGDGQASSDHNPVLALFEP